MSERQGSNSKQKRVKEGVPTGGEYAADEFEPGDADLSGEMAEYGDAPVDRKLGDGPEVPWSMEQFDDWANGELDPALIEEFENRNPPFEPEYDADAPYPYEPEDEGVFVVPDDYSRPVTLGEEIGYDPDNPFGDVPDADDFHDEQDTTNEILIPPPWQPKNPDPRHEWNITPEEEAERDAYELERRAIIAKVEASEAADRINNTLRIANDPVGMADDVEYARSLGYKGQFTAWAGEDGVMEYDPAEWAGVNQFLDKKEAEEQRKIERGEGPPQPVQHTGGSSLHRSNSPGPYRGRNAFLGAASKQFGKLSDFMWNRWNDYLDS